MYSTGNSSQYSRMTYVGKESKREWIYIYMIHLAIQQKLTNIVNKLCFTIFFFSKMVGLRTDY